MRTEDFPDWLSKSSELTPSQRQQAIDHLSQKQEPDEVIGAIVGPNPPCPHCHHAPCSRWGNAPGLPRYRCGACGKTFNALTKTPVARLRRRECWTAYAQAMIAGETVRAAARRCGVHKNTSFRWRPRFLAKLCGTKPLHLHGIVEADETYFLESFTGSRNLPRPARKRGGKAAKRGLSDEQIPVLIARDRTTATTDAVLESANTQEVRAVLEPILDPDAVLCSDGSAVFVALAKQLHIAHQPVNLSAGIRVVDNAFHIQNVNAYDSRLKGWMYRFHGVATKYLPNYLGWHRCLEWFSGTLTPEFFLGLAFGVPSAGDQHLTQT
jgi:transposase-like protein